MLVGVKKLNIIVMSKTLSTAGRYEIFFGVHWDGKQNCYDVGAIHLGTQEVIRRHYKGKEISKAEALAFWEEFKTKMTEPAKPQETDDVDPKIIIN